ncbi:hypothetical protein OAF09_01570, partial [bacterium]|nr:hypothetical protein [bacterium]
IREKVLLCMLLYLQMKSESIIVGRWVRPYLILDSELILADGLKFAIRCFSQYDPPLKRVFRSIMARPRASIPDRATRKQPTIVAVVTAGSTRRFFQRIIFIIVSGRASRGDFSNFCPNAHHLKIALDSIGFRSV